MDVFKINNSVELKAQETNINSQVMLMNKQITSKQDDSPLMKTMYPIYLYKPPFGYPRNVNVVFLRELAKNPYVFAVIKAIIDQASETKWEIKPKEDIEMTPELKESQKYITEFFKNPNSDNESFSQLLRKVISDILVLDSGCFVKIYNRKKELLQLRAIDGGAMLKNPNNKGSMFEREDIIFDDGYFGMGAGKGFEQKKNVYKVALDRYESYGYTDQAAYYQFAYGVNYSVPIPYGKKEIIYMMENPASETVYSRGSALQSSVDVTLNLIYSSKASLDLFLNANIPNGIIQLAGAGQEDAVAFQEAFYNQQYSGVDEYGFQRKVNGRLPVVGNPDVKFVPLQFKTNESEMLQIQEWYTKVLWMCYDEETEILTEKGWKHFKDLNKTEEVARINPDTLEMDFVKPVDYQEYNFNGNMLHYKNRNCDLLVTPEHKLLYSTLNNFKNGKFGFMQDEAKNLNKKDIVLPQAPLIYKGKIIEHLNFKTIIATSWGHTKKQSFKINGDNFCKFMGIWLADGWVESSNNRVSLCASEVYPENIMFIENLLNNMNVKYKLQVSKANGCIQGRIVNINGNMNTYRFSNKSFADYLRQFGKAHDKFVPDVIKNSTKEQIKMFFDAYELGDGCKAKKGQNRRFFSMSKNLIDDCQEMMLRQGKASNINQWNNGYELTERKSKTELHKNKYFSYVYKDSINEKKYNGKVYDVTVPKHHFIVVRRNGRVTLSGNCFGVNSSEMGFTAGDSKATDQSQSKVAARKAVKPRLSLIANYLNDQVLPELPFGDLFEFCFDEYDIEEDGKKWDLYKVKIDSGVMSPEMVARKEGIDVDELKKDMADRQKLMQENDSNEDGNEDGNEDMKKEDKKDDKPEVKSTYNFGENLVITGKNKEDLLKQAVDLCEQESEPEMKANPKIKEFPKSTATELVMTEFEKEYNEMIKTSVDKILK